MESEDGLPIPPMSLSAGYCNNQKDYIITGQTHFDEMIKALNSTGFKVKEGMKIYEFGCAAGRVLRCFSKFSGKVEMWGSDISAPAIHWCQHHLTPPFNFFVNTTLPSLPFSPNSFDLIYAGSIFTHLDELEDMWLLELKRILKPGGRIFISISDNSTLNIVMDAKPDNWLYDTAFRKDLLAFEAIHNFRKSGFSKFLLSREPGNTQVVHDIEFLKKKWGGFMNIVQVVPEGQGYQTAIILTK